jgi:N-acetylglutamate synthase-like GNAT family acetyltransferase
VSSDDLRLVPISHAKEFAAEALSWSLKLWGEGKDEFTSEDWHSFYSRTLNSDYDNWDTDRTDQELLFMVLRNNKDGQEVVGSIALCDFDDFEEFRQYKPWIAAFVVRQDLRGTGIGSQVLNLIEQKAFDFGIKQIYLWTEESKDFYAKRGYVFMHVLNKPNRLINLMQKKLSSN